MSYINYIIILCFIAATIYLIVKAENKEEPYYALKIIGYYFLGTFRFTFNGLHIPLGFIVYILFFRNSKHNQKAKKYAAVLGLIAFILSLSIPAVSESYYQRARYVDVIDNNIYSMDFESQWLQVAEVLELDEHLINTAKVEEFNADYEPEGQLKRLNYELTWRENQQFYHASIDYEDRMKRLRIKPVKVSEWLQYNRISKADQTFNKLEELNIKNMTSLVSADEGAYFTLSGVYGGNLGVSNHELLVLEKDKTIPYTGEIPVRCNWFVIYEMQPEGANGYSSDNTYYFLFDIQKD